MSTEEFLFRIAADTKELREELKKARAETGKFSDDLDKANEKGLALNTSLSKVASGVAMVATGVAAATTAFIAYSTAQGRAIRETEIMAQAAGLSVEEFRKMSFIMGTVGLDGEKFGDIMKDTQERIGDFLATGGGPFQDFADVMGYTKDEAIALAAEFETMNGQQVLQAMVTRMEEAGKSTQQMSFALEGMSSETTRLIPLLKDGGAQAAALGKTFDSINVELSEEERAQFKALADNVDLAQSSFINFLNNSIAPFLPAINAATVALAEFFATAQRDQDIDEIIDDEEAVKAIDTFKELNQLEERANELIKEKKQLRVELLRGRKDETGFGRQVIKDEIEGLEKAIELIGQRRIALEKEQEEKQKPIDLESKKGTLTGGTGGSVTSAEGIDLKQQLLDDLAARQDAKKSALTLLEEERDERYAILKGMYADENALSDEMKQQKADRAAEIEAAYIEQVQALAQTQEEMRIEAAERELSGLAELFENKLISQEQYEEKRREIIGQYDPTSLDPEALEEKNQLELDQLRDKLEEQLISYEDYYTQLAALQKKDTEDKKKQKELENWWSESSVKKQIDLGTTLLTSLGNNSKKQHKIQQGLSAANAGMNTAEGVTKALAAQDYAGAALTALTGAAQIAAIWTSTPDGGGSSSQAAAATPADTPAVTYSEQTTTVTDITEDVSSQAIFRIEFTDEVVDAVARKIDKAKSDGRI